MENVTLRTGTQVTIAAATAALLSIDDYLDCKEPFAFYELVMVARDPSHVPYGDMGSRMNRLGLVDAAGDDARHHTRCRPGLCGWRRPPAPTCQPRLTDGPTHPVSPV